MFDWLTVSIHLLWLLGLTLLLSSLSLAHWHAHQQRRPFRELILEPFFHLTIVMGLGLFALGLALIVQPWGYKIGWLGLMAVAGWQGIMVWRRAMQ
jgi:hypothetical protein